MSGNRVERILSNGLIRVWVSSYDGTVWLAYWYIRQGKYGMHNAYEIRTAADWNQVLDQLEDILP